MMPEEQERLARIERELWAKIREYQTSGGKVRNVRMAEKYGGRSGTYFNSSSRTACLIGLYAGVDSPYWHEPIMAMFKLTREEAAHLEFGFECYRVDATRFTFQPFYQLGRSIGEKLEEEEEAAHGSGL
jgi:hypothetical protein